MRGLPCERAQSLARRSVLGWRYSGDRTAQKKACATCYEPRCDGGGAFFTPQSFVEKRLPVISRGIPCGPWRQQQPAAGKKCCSPCHRTAPHCGGSAPSLRGLPQPPGPLPFARPIPCLAGEVPPPPPAQYMIPHTTCWASTELLLRVYPR